MVLWTVLSFVDHIFYVWFCFFHNEWIKVFKYLANYRLSTLTFIRKKQVSWKMIVWFNIRRSIHWLSTFSFIVLPIYWTIRKIQKERTPKENPKQQNWNVAGSVWLSLFMDGIVKCKLPSTPPSTVKLLYTISYRPNGKLILNWKQFMFKFLYMLT